MRGRKKNGRRGIGGLKNVSGFMIEPLYMLQKQPCSPSIMYSGLVFKCDTITLEKALLLTPHYHA